MKQILHNVSPLNNEKEMSSAMYIVKKILAFLMIYGVSMIVGEVVVIGVLIAFGYDPIHGVMPEGDSGLLIKYYGYAIFLIITVLYCIVIEKRSLQSMGITKNVWNYLIGAGLAILLLTVITVISCVIGVVQYEGVAPIANGFNIMSFLVAFMIQGATEEIMCRGFLMQSLREKVSLPVAILVSAVAFIYPHVSSLVESDWIYAVIGIVNLLLISFIFSLLVVKHCNIWVSCGLHSVWNFVLYSVMGLHLSGSEQAACGLINLKVASASIWNGGEYGIEAGLITVFVLGITCTIMVKAVRTLEHDKNGKREGEA